MRAAILAGGSFGGTARRLRRAELLICADGGLRVARRFRLRPDVAIGDFDSATPALVAWARAAGATFLRHHPEKDKTDAELALEYALEQGAREIEFFGALGGRLDHLLANVALLRQAAARGARMTIVDRGTEAFLVRSRVTLTAQAGDLVSLLALSPRVSGITTRGLKYPLRNATLRAGSSLGISNVVVARSASVSIRSGELLVVLTAR